RRIRSAKLPRWDHVRHRRTWYRSLHLTRRTARSVGQNHDWHDKPVRRGSQQTVVFPPVGGSLWRERVVANAWRALEILSLNPLVQTRPGGIAYRPGI